MFSPGFPHMESHQDPGPALSAEVQALSGGTLLSTVIHPCWWPQLWEQLWREEGRGGAAEAGTSR